MDIDSPASSYTILRIKRKRTDEPLDALVVESESRVRRKKSRGGGGGGVFQFAQTIEQDAWEDEKRQRELQDQISRMAKENVNVNKTVTESSSSSPQQSAASSTTTATATSAASSNTRSSPSTLRLNDESNRRYTIVPQDLPNETKGPRFPTSPPKVISHKDVARKATPFKLYDAVLSNTAAAAAATATPPLDPEMDKFIPMLNDYLRLHDIDPNPDANPDSKQPGSLHSSSRTPSSDYVWDIFYHRPVTLSEWNEAAKAKIATLTGLPPSITDPYDSDSDSEPEDEADEDSNGTSLRLRCAIHLHPRFVLAF
ncbi:hypothetical protein D9615_006963 [Tricholomella constricta]|uniref:Uncharacterized protein n=1 Tax=Tricholomella constricta TaxID=117010 RepID=A0A8H5H8V6_9AGAR|nr:hypothetical protein D9615_006963 [Tricholomella constricta]